MAVVNTGPGWLDWAAYVGGGSLKLTDTPSWSSLSAELCESLSGASLGALSLSVSGTTVTVTVSGVLAASHASGVWWRLKDSGQVVIGGRFRADDLPSNSWREVPVVVSGGATVSAGATGPVGPDGPVGPVDTTTAAALAVEVSIRSAADTALDGRLDTIEAISIATDAELAAAVALRVAKAGDTMTGPLNVSPEGTGVTGLNVRAFDAASTSPILARDSAGNTVFGVAVTGTRGTSATVTQSVEAGNSAGETALLRTQGFVSGLRFLSGASVQEWQIYRTGAAASPLFFRDLVASRNTMTLVSGASNDASRVGVDARLNVGFSDLGATFGVQASAASRVGLQVKLAAGQTANAFEIQNSAGTNLLWVTPAGRLDTDNLIRSRFAYVGDAPPFAGMWGVTSIGNTIGTIVRAGVGQTNNLSQWETNAGTVMTSIGATGNLTLNVDNGGIQINTAAGAAQWSFLRLTGSGPLYLQNLVNARTQMAFNAGADYDSSNTAAYSRFNVGSNVDLGATLGVQATSASRKGILVKLAAAATGNSFEAQTSAGSINFSVNSDGNLTARKVHASTLGDFAANVALTAQAGGAGFQAGILRAASGQTAQILTLQDSTGATLFGVLPSGRESHVAANTATTVGAAGAAAALPVLPLGYLLADIAGTSVKIPYYTA